jgi:hypothetical protein
MLYPKEGWSGIDTDVKVSTNYKLHGDADEKDRIYFRILPEQNTEENVFAS